MARFFSPAIRLFAKDRSIQVSFIVAALINVLSFVVLAWRFPLSSLTPLHYNVYFGIDFIGSALEIYALPASGLVLLLVNLVVASRIWRRDRILSYFVMAGALACSIILTVSAGLILYLNIRT